MGWKSVKEHYGIGHIVQVTEKGICIGSGFVPEIIVIGNDLSIWRSQYIGHGEPFDGWVRAMEADKEKLRRLIEQPDTFERSLIVYTFEGCGEILEKRCEQLGWPNVTHDGLLMYENMFSTDRAQVIEWAKRNAAAGIDCIGRTIARVEQEQAARRALLEGYRAALEKLERGV